MNLFILLSESDKKALIVLLVIAMVLFLIIGLLGVAVRKTMIYQGKKADNMLHDVAITHVVDTPAAFKKLGLKKNCRKLFKESLYPFLIAFIGLLIYLITNIATSRWNENPFVIFSELFYSFDWNAEEVWTKVFGITLLANFPPVSHRPTFILANLPFYIAAACFYVAIVYYLISCQAFISRAIMINRRASSVFEKSLEGFKASEDIKITPDKPLPPSE